MKPLFATLAAAGLIGALGAGPAIAQSSSTDAQAANARAVQQATVKKGGLTIEYSYPVNSESTRGLDARPNVWIPPQNHQAADQNMTQGK